MRADCPTGSARGGRSGAEPMLTTSFPCGAIIPDWSDVQSPVARAALGAAFDTFIGRKWHGLDETDDCVRRAVLELYAATGKGPSLHGIALAIGLAAERVAGSFRRLADRDLIVLDANGQIVGAYPFSDSDTGHRVELPAVSIAAMCAIDALGMGAMLAQDTAIRSSCRLCGQAVEIGTRDRGRNLAVVSPEGTVVWSGILYGGACAATSLCTVQAFFCSDEHLERWRAGGPAGGANGFRLSLEEAFQVGCAIFAPMLSASKAAASELTTSARGPP
jgi:alkylmercury lyase